MADEKNVYVVLRLSGLPMRFQSGMWGDGTYHAGPYTSVLDAIATEQESAGGNHDSADKLFLNGKCVVERGLSTIAYKYRRDSLDARTAAARAVANRHMPSWLPDNEQKPGYNPPGVDTWLVRHKDDVSGGEAALAIGEHAFRAGYMAGQNDGMIASEATEQAAWSAYEPPEHIKALS